MTPVHHECISAPCVYCIWAYKPYLMRKDKIQIDRLDIPRMLIFYTLYEE